MSKILEEIKNSKRIVIKIGTSTLTNESGNLNFRRIDKLARVLADLSNEDRDICLVSSGAIGAGMGKMGFSVRPTITMEKQAVAAIGQVELMNIYSKFFGEYTKKVAQILLTKDVLDGGTREENALNTFKTLFSWGVIPVVNENDTISTAEMVDVFGENDSLAAYVAILIKADTVVILSDIDGLYDSNPSLNADAKLIGLVNEITPEIYSIAGGAGSSVGTGGMTTKIHAAEMLLEKDIKMIIANGHDPRKLYDIFEGYHRGTIFAKESLD